MKGLGEMGQLGLGPDVMMRNFPTHINKLDACVFVTAGGIHTACINEDDSQVRIVQGLRVRTE